jgi:predicted GIY-YIG superfamily endonuclease
MQSNKSGVYIIKDYDGSPLYVGYSSNLGSRIKSHAKRFPQSLSSENVTVIPCADAMDAKALESRVLMSMKPKQNKHIPTEAFTAPSGSALLLRKWMEKEGRFTKWLAETIPVNRSHLHQWLNEKHTPRMVYRLRIAEITGGDVPAWSWTE